MAVGRFVVGMFSVGIISVGTCGAYAQDYPNKPIRIVTAGIGGGTDFTARLVARGLSGPLGQSLIVDNRPGIIPQEIVSKALPDGYTLLVQGQVLWITPLLQNVTYDPVTDLMPITLTDRAPSILVVNPSLSATSVRELIALAKAKPGQLNFASTGAGTAGHLAGALFKSMAGINIVWVPYPSMAGAVTDLLSNQVQIIMASAGPTAAYVKVGRLKALAIASAQPSALAPGLPTVAESGLPGYEAVSYAGVLAPAKTPAAIINRLNREIKQVLSTADVRDKLFADGSETVPCSPQEFAAVIKSDIAKYGKVIKDAGIKVN